MTRKDSESVRMEKHVQAEAVACSKVRKSESRSRDGERTKEAKFMNPRRREKLLNFMRYPYRKPTQVDEKKILRRTGELLLRNSAK